MVSALTAYLWVPDNSENANQMHLSIHSMPPGFKVNILTIPVTTENTQTWGSLFLNGKKNQEQAIPIHSYEIKEDTLITYAYQRDGSKGLYKAYTVENFKTVAHVNEIPPKYITKRTFLLGTDKYGRDLLSRLIVGMRVSLSIGFIAVSISLFIGIFFGAISGYFGGRVDAVIMWIINVTWSIPTLLLVIAITLALGKGFWQVFIAVGLTMWVEVARVIRGQILSVKEMQYVTAARALGFSHFRIIVKHILPNCMAPVIVIAAANFAAAILIESGLSFLGIGAQPPTPSWGGIIKNHYHYIIMGKPYLSLIPGVALMLVVAAFMLMSNAIRDAFSER